MNNNEELITFIDINNLTKLYFPIIEELIDTLEGYIEQNDTKEVPLTEYCQRKKTTECPYFNSICGKKIPESNSIFHYLNCNVIKDDKNKSHKLLDLVNEGYLDMLDIPESWIKSKKHQIQRDCYKNNSVYIDKEKIIKTFDLLKYPIYHLDFETFPCPIPRFKGESPYSQSVFEYSLHIEREPGKCDLEKDNYVFLAKSLNDEREELIKDLLSHFDKPGTLFAQNYGFEKSRIKELAFAFPKYKDKLLRIIDNSVDLIWFLNTNKSYFESLGFDEERAGLPNYYCKELSGSYSIKRTLPVFSKLSYKELDIHNGTDALVAYANYNIMSQEELQKTYEDLRVYCRQDTYAMYVILDALREIVKNM